MAQVLGCGRFGARKNSFQRPIAGQRASVEALEERRLLSFVTFPLPAASSSENAFDLGTLAHGPDGNIWVADPSGPRILRVKHDGAIAQFPLPEKSYPVAIAAGPDANVWFLDGGLNKVGKVTSAGVITEYPIPHSSTLDLQFTRITAGADGNVWFYGYNNKLGVSFIDRATPDGTITEILLPKTIEEVGAITAGPDGNMWFASLDDHLTDQIGRISASGAITYFPYRIQPDPTTFNPVAPITSLIDGHDGNLWLSAGSEIDKITIAGKVAARFITDAPRADSGFPVRTFGLTLASDGDFWFGTTESSNQLGRLTPAGIFNSVNIPGGLPFAFFPAPEIGAQVEDLASGGDGSLWFLSTGASGNTIVRADVRNSIFAANEYVDTSSGSPVNATVAQFIDTGAIQPPSAYKATVTFGDGTHVAGTITSGVGGGFIVSVDRLWPTGTGTATVAITDIRNPTRTATAADIITAVPTQPVGSALTVNPVAGKTFAGNVARFSHVDVTSISQYYASIDWGDGQQSEGSLKADGAGGVFVAGTHIYASLGSYKVDVVLTPPDARPRDLSTWVIPKSGEIISKAVVNPGVMSGVGYTLLVHTHKVLGQAEAIFTLANAAADLSHYHATLIWRDSSTDAKHPQRAASILPRADGQFLIFSPMKFIGQGVAYYQIVISDDRLGSGNAATVGTAYGEIVVDYPDIKPFDDGYGAYVDLPTAVLNGSLDDAGYSGFDELFNPTLTERADSFDQALTGIANQAFSGDVGRIAGIIPNAPRQKDMHGTIHWGDGSTSVASFTLDGNGGIHVKGGHTYAHAGKYTITVYLSQTIFADGAPEGVPDIRLPTITSSIRVSNAVG